MKRVYNDEGFWTEDATHGVMLITEQLNAVFATLEAAGFNSREAGILIVEEAHMIAVEKMIDARAKPKAEPEPVKAPEPRLDPKAEVEREEAEWWASPYNPSNQN